MANATALTEANTTLLPPWPDELQSQVYILLTTIFFSLIILVGLFTNSLVLVTLARWPMEMRIPCNILIGNICAADLGVCVFAAPLRIIEIYLGWIFGQAMCFIFTPLQDVFVVVSVAAQTIIALERHRAIVTPFKPKMTLKRVKKFVLVIWIASYLTAGLPMMIFLKNELYEDRYYCFPVFTKDQYRIAYQIYIVVLFIVLPLAIQCIAYFNIIRVLRAKEVFHRRGSSVEFFKKRIHQKRRLVRMSLALMLAFQVCYLPRGVVMLIQEFKPETTFKLEFLYIEMITLAMYYLKHVINPFILWATSNDFRAGCLKLCQS